MIYLYSAKYNYFKKEDITEDDLKVVIDNDSNMTVKEYLKETALSDLKTSSAIRKMADDNNIVLNTCKDIDSKNRTIKSSDLIEIIEARIEETKTILAYLRASLSGKIALNNIFKF